MSGDGGIGGMGAVAGGGCGWLSRWMALALAMVAVVAMWSCRMALAVAVAMVAVVASDCGYGGVGLVREGVQKGAPHTPDAAHESDPSETAPPGHGASQATLMRMASGVHCDPAPSEAVEPKE